MLQDVGVRRVPDLNILSSLWLNGEPEQQLFVRLT